MGFNGLRCNEKAKYEQFCTDFHHSGLSSIDRFLRDRPEYSELGKIAISYYINTAERRSRNNLPSDWIAWIYNRFHMQGFDIDSWPVSFITFNYDRILESSLATMIANTKRISFTEAYQLVSEKLFIHHVYGKLAVDPKGLAQNPSVCNFTSVNEIDKQATGIQLLTEERESDAQASRFAEAVGRFLGASTLIFLGFGFDPVNCRRFTRCYSQDETSHFQRVVASGYGMTKREQRDAERELRMEIEFGGSEVMCLEFLREFVSL